MSVFSHKSFQGHEQVVFCHDEATGLKSIIAIHDTTLGPALGGCRFWDYQNEEDAIRDVLRLSRGMTYKAAVSGLNLGGGKAVIIGDAKRLKSEALFKKFGRFVDGLGGRYITAEDVNINVKDMDYVATQTKHVTGVSGGSGDPSPMTAWGVFHGIRAAVQHRFGKESLKGLKVAVQGVGHVGSYLCEYLHNAGVQLFVTDIDQERIQSVVKRFGAQAVDQREIITADVDVYAPCALGATLNDDSIPKLRAKVIAGAANNQLMDEQKHGKQLQEMKILYAPDYVINAGGLINVYNELRGYQESTARAQTEKIYQTLMQVFTDADRQKISTAMAANRVAEARIAAARESHGSGAKNSVGERVVVKAGA